MEDLLKPDFVDDDSSSNCFEYLDSGDILVGHETGCYLSNIDTHSTQTDLSVFNGKEVTSICSKRADKNQLFVSCEKSIYCFDRRISLDKHQHVFSNNTEEINQLRVNTSDHLAACDDNGEVQVFDLKMNSSFRHLRRKHNNICSCVSFLPGRIDDIVTGGLDSQILAWDYKRVKILQTINTQDLLLELGDDSVYMFNPPFVYALEVSDDGKSVASGLANGTIQIFKTLKGKRVLAPSVLINRHSTVGVSALCFVESKDGSTMLISGGNDGIVNLWNIPNDPPLEKKKKQLSLENKVYITDEDIEKILLKSIDTHSKVNFIESAVVSNEQIVFVGDQTPIVKWFKVSS